jgi:hypothetical protein
MKPWWWPMMKRIRWDENPAKSHKKQRFARVNDVMFPPDCRCGRQMVTRAAYMLGGPDYCWVAYQCPDDRPWSFWKHSPWTTLRCKEV